MADSCLILAGWGCRFGGTTSQNGTGQFKVQLWFLCDANGVVSTTDSKWHAWKPTFGVAGVQRVGDVARQAHMQGAAEALVVRLGGRIRHDAVRVVKLPTKRDDAALHPIIRLLTHKALMDAWNESEKNKKKENWKLWCVSGKTCHGLKLTKPDPPVLHSWQRNFPLGAAESPMHCRWKAPKHGPSHTRSSPVFSHTY